MGRKYHKVGDYLLPNITPNKDVQKTYGKWGQLRREFLKEHRESDYNLLMMKGALTAYLNAFDEEAQEMHERIMDKLEKNIFEPPQGTMEWIQWQNSLRFLADEQVFNDLIYN